MSEHDEQTIEDKLHYADELKAEGNDHFRARRWEEALAAYRLGLGRLPKRKRNEKQKAPSKDDDVSKIEESIPAQGGSSATEPVSPSPQTTEPADVPAEPLTEDEKRCANARAVLNANIGACFVKLGEHKEAVDACTQALLEDPVYVKALQRRASSNEAISSWSSLTSAQEDYQKLLSLLPSTSSEAKDVERTLRLLKPRVEEAQKKETAEMLDKLKGFGNNILGNFGLSTDNFKFVPNGQGGYSVNFSR